MSLKKYKYYFRKPRSEIAKDIFLTLLLGSILILGSGPLTANLFRINPKWRVYSRKKVSDTFSRFQKQKLILVERSNKQIFISLTPEGKRKAGRFQIDSLNIVKPKKWDGKWRLLMFDIQEQRRFWREALRGKLKELGFYPFQKSVWVHAFDCRAEIEILEDFFGFTDKDIRLIVSGDIGDDEYLRRIFKV